MLRADNADQRLTGSVIALGCVGAERVAAFAAKSTALADGEAWRNGLTLTPDEAGRRGLTLNRDGRQRSAYELLSYPDIDLAGSPIWPETESRCRTIAEQLAVDARYAGYLARQENDIAAFRKEESLVIPQTCLRRHRRPLHRTPPEAGTSTARQSRPGGPARRHDACGAPPLLAHLKKDRGGRLPERGG